MLEHYKINVQGRVQGVGFRYAAKRHAELLRLKGFVKNNYDGSVKIEVEGESENLKLFLQWCYKGSEFADVDKVDSNIGQIKNYKYFDVRF